MISEVQTFLSDDAEGDAAVDMMHATMETDQSPQNNRK